MMFEHFTDIQKKNQNKTNQTETTPQCPELIAHQIMDVMTPDPIEKLI